MKEVTNISEILTAKLTSNIQDHEIKTKLEVYRHKIA